MKVSFPFRAATWWLHIVPPILSVVYLLALGLDIPFRYLFSTDLALFTGAVIPFAAWGYFLNDLTDIKSDAAAGKENFAAKIPFWGRIPVLILLSGLSVLPWLFLPENPTVWIVLGAEALALVLYSVPPFRFKERGLAGLLCDMSYGHILPLLITVFVFLPPAILAKSQPWVLILTILLLWAFFKGLRNIVVHQIEDRKKDAMAGVKTFVHNYGPLPALHMIHTFVLPMEFLIFTVLLIILAVQGLPLILFFAGFLLLTFFKFSLWKLPSLPRKQRWFKFLYFLNDFYEDWMPVALLLMLSFRESEFFILLGLHILLFPVILLNLGRDLKAVAQNIKDLS